MNRKTSIPAPVGGSSLLVIFAVLCLTVFALLGLATVTADKRLADDNYEALKSYYQADYEAEQILGQIRAGKVPTDVIKKENQYTYSCRMNDTQELKVVVLVEEDSYKIMQWRVTETVEWQPDEFIDLFEMEDF